MRLSVDFQKMVGQLASPQPNMDFLHGAVGAATEAGELLDQAKKHIFYRRQIDQANVIEELGDMLFYMELVRQSLGLSWPEIEKKNMEKLAKRYPAGTFSAEDATARKDKDE